MCICLDYVLRTSIDKMKDNGIKLAKERRRYHAQTITYVDYADNISSSSSSCRGISTDIPDPLSPPLPNIHRFRLVLRATSRILRAVVCRFELVTPAFARPCEWFHWNTSLMSSSLLLQLRPICFVCLIWIVFVLAGRWPCSYFFVGCCLQDVFNIARSILV